MAWDFPASPTEGAVYTPAGGPTYTYTSGIWRVLPTPQTALSSKSIGDTPPLNPIHGQSWWNSTDGFSYIYYVDPGGAPGQWVQESDASLPDAPSDGKLYGRQSGIWASAGYRLIADVTIATAKLTHDVTIPTDVTMLRISGNYEATVSNAQLGLRCSADGVTFDSGAAAYSQAYTSTSGTTTISAGALNSSYMTLTSGSDNSQHWRVPIDLVMSLGLDGARLTR